MDPETEYKVQVLRYVTVSWTVICFWEHIIWFNAEASIWHDLYRYLTNARRRHRNRDRRFSSFAGDGRGAVADKGGSVPLSRRKSSIATLASTLQPTHSQTLARHRSPQLGKLLVLGVRYTLLVCTALSFTFYLGRPKACSQIFTALWALFALCWACGSAIFLLRVYIIWEKSRRVLVIFLVIWICTLAGWAYDVTQYRVLRVDHLASPQPWCLPAPDSKFRAFCWGLCLWFDSSVLVATFFKLRQDHGAAALWRIGIGIGIGSPFSRGRRGSGLAAPHRSIFRSNARARARTRPTATAERRASSTLSSETCDLESALACDSPNSSDLGLDTTLNRAAITKQYLLRSNLAYFFIAFAVNLSCFVVELAVKDTVLSHMPSPIAFALNPLVAVRSVFVAENYIRAQMDRTQQARFDDVVRSGVGSAGPAAGLFDSSDPFDLLTRAEAVPVLATSAAALTPPPPAAATGTLIRASGGAALGLSSSPPASSTHTIYESEEEKVEEAK